MLLERLSYYSAKLRRAWRDGTLAERTVRKVRSLIRSNVIAVSGYIRLSPEDRRRPAGDGFADRGPAPPLTPQRRALLDRLIGAYSAAVRDLPGAAEVYQPRGLWDEWIGLHYPRLVAAVRERDYDALGALLHNSAREPFATGTGGSYDDLVRYRSSIFGRAYIRTVWCDYRDKLRAAGGDPDAVTYPDVGSPAGLTMGGAPVPIETFRHAANAEEMWGLLGEEREAVVVEIGGGFGSQLYQAVRRFERGGEPLGMYADFDIPEVLLVASYFALEAMPGARVRLYGEGDVTVDPGSADVALYPHFAIEQVPAGSVSLVLNTNSLAEMDGVAAANYMAELDRIEPRYFMHTNHETRLALRQPDGTVSTNRLGSELAPDPARYQRVFKRPRSFGRPEDGGFTSYSYLFARQPDHASR